MITSDSMRGFNDLIILAILAEGDNYGYEMSQKIHQLSDQRYLLKETTLYSALTRLEKNGWLISYDGSHTHGRKRTYYAITDAGRMELESRQEEWSEIKAVIDTILKEVSRGNH